MLIRLVVQVNGAHALFNSIFAVKVKAGCIIGIASKGVTSFLMTRNGNGNLSTNRYTLSRTDFLKLTVLFATLVDSLERQVNFLLLYWSIMNINGVHILGYNIVAGKSVASSGGRVFAGQLVAINIASYNIIRNLGTNQCALVLAKIKGLAGVVEHALDDKVNALLFGRLLLGFIVHIDSLQTLDSIGLCNRGAGGLRCNIADGVTFARSEVVNKFPNGLVCKNVLSREEGDVLAVKLAAIENAYNVNVANLGSGLFSNLLVINIEITSFLHRGGCGNRGTCVCSGKTIVGVTVNVRCIQEISNGLICCDFVAEDNLGILSNGAIFIEIMSRNLEAYGLLIGGRLLLLGLLYIKGEVCVSLNCVRLSNCLVVLVVAADISTMAIRIGLITLKLASEVVINRLRGNASRCLPIKRRSGRWATYNIHVDAHIIL